MHNEIRTKHCSFCDRTYRRGSQVPPKWCFHVDNEKPNPKKCWLLPMSKAYPELTPGNARVHSHVRRVKPFLLRVKGNIYLVSNNKVRDIGHGAVPPLKPNSHVYHFLTHLGKPPPKPATRRKTTKRKKK